jgi:putative Holliday junction resolvase
MGIDYGLQRTGIAVTDPLQIIVSGLDTVDTKIIMDFLVGYEKRSQLIPLLLDIHFSMGNGGIRNLKRHWIHLLKT